MAEDVRARLAELDSLLTSGARERPLVTFGSLKRNDPTRHSTRVRYERQLDAARAEYALAVEQHTAAEADRLRRLASQRTAYDAAASAFAESVAEHNAGIDQFWQDCRAGDPEAVARFCTLVLDSSVYPEGFPLQTRTIYRPDPKESCHRVGTAAAVGDPARPRLPVRS